MTSMTHLKYIHLVNDITLSNLRVPINLTRETTIDIPKNVINNYYLDQTPVSELIVSFVLNHRHGWDSRKIHMSIDDVLKFDKRKRKMLKTMDLLEHYSKKSNKAKIIDYFKNHSISQKAYTDEYREYKQSNKITKDLVLSEFEFMQDEFDLLIYNHNLSMKRITQVITYVFKNVELMNIQYLKLIEKRQVEYALHKSNIYHLNLDQFETPSEYNCINIEKPWRGYTRVEQINILREVYYMLNSLSPEYQSIAY